MRICNQSIQKVLIRPKKDFIQKFNLVINKTQNFTLIPNPLRKFRKNAQKKVICKNVTEICTFVTFTHVRQTCFAYNFFSVHFLTIFSTDLKSAYYSAFFDIFFNLKKKFFGHISTL